MVRRIVLLVVLLGCATAPAAADQRGAALIKQRLLRELTRAFARFEARYPSRK